MTAPIWRLLMFDERNTNTDEVTKAHIVPASLQRALLADLAARGMDAKPRVKPIKTTGMDQPGMIHTQRPWETFRLPGLRFDLPSEDVRYFLDRVKALNERELPGGRPYYKLHSWLNCIVLKPVTKLALEIQLEARVKIAEQRAMEFYADKKPTNTVLREAAAIVSNVPVESIPDLVGPTDRRNDRFFAVHGKRGEA